MALSASSMAAKIRAHTEALSHAQTSNEAAAKSYAQTHLEAFCQGIIDEFVANARVYTTSGAPDSEHEGKIE